MKKSIITRETILQAGKTEFLEKGYKDANVRQIASRAGVTTGAIYSYFTDKKAIFEALVEPVAGDFMNRFEKALNSFTLLPNDDQIKEVHGYCDYELGGILHHIYNHFDCFRLITCCSSGTPYENYIDRLVDLEAEATVRFIDVLKQQGYQPPELSFNLIHILSNAYFSTVFEAVAHNMDKQEADAYVEHITTFFTAGWDSLLKLQ